MAKRKLHPSFLANAKAMKELAASRRKQQAVGNGRDVSKSRAKTRVRKAKPKTKVGQRRRLHKK